MKKILLPIGLLVILVLVAFVAGKIRNKNNDSLPNNETSGTVPQMTPENNSNIDPIQKTVFATLETSMGNIKLELDGKAAPNTVGNFVKLSKSGFFNGTTFHRVIPDFMIQGGDPLSKDPSKRMMHGTGGPGYDFADEINNRKIVKGSLAMANSGPDTNGSQFFIVTAESTPWLDGKHTNFGSVVSGMDVVEKISLVEKDGNDNPLTPVVITRITIEE